MKAVTLASFRKQLNKYLAEVTDSQDVLIVAGKKEDDAVVCLSIKEYNSVIETSHLLSTKANRNWLDESISQFESGEYKTIDIEHYFN
ncbi:type II toxin-antitoxin system Phd/YefM family antitoxin [Flavobacterium sp.]|uniref:type II toxin-antitoxin system Phd/YefM family antitoxin n=1 Tax=Flavobacterium sp. TaxID=239 RepID=UPI00262A06B8|nr:type II toxin-antitoxin system Phd/YefM family antitoxin [Flavobacterium sp.]